MTSKEQVVLRPDRYNKLIETFERLELSEAKARMEIEQLQEAFDRKNEVHDTLNRDYVKVRDENERLREALEFYADIENHQNNFLGSKISRIDLDAGNTAAKALAGESNE